MDYKDIFRPDTLEKLNKRSQENLKKMMGDKTFMQTIMSSTRLLQEIMKIEALYKEQLEQLAIQMVEDMYPIIIEDGINIDAKIVSMGDVNKSLDEIKIDKPGKNIKIDKDNNYYSIIFPDGYKIPNLFLIDNLKYASKKLKGDKILWDDGNYDFDTNELFDPFNKHIKYLKKYKIPYIIRKAKLDNSFRINIDITRYFSENLNESTPESKRRVINGITQGAALHGTFSFYMFKEYLDAIDDTLVEKYNQLMKEVFGVYDDDNAIAMFLQMIAQGQKMGGGSSKVVINEIKIDKPINVSKLKWGDWSKLLNNSKPDTLKKYGYQNTGLGNFIMKILTPSQKIQLYKELTKQNLQENNQQSPTIQARAICFPMLVHEIIKGLYELVSLQGFQGTKDQNQAVVDKVDKLENEPHDLKYGKYIYDALNNIYAESGYDDSRIREFFFAEVYQLGDQEFVDFVENALNDELTPSQQSWIKQILKEIQMDLRSDDFDSTGLDEIKISNPLKPEIIGLNKYRADLSKKTGKSTKKLDLVVGKYKISGDEYGVEMNFDEGEKFLGGATKKNINKFFAGILRIQPIKIYIGIVPRPESIWDDVLGNNKLEYNKYVKSFYIYGEYKGTPIIISRKETATAGAGQTYLVSPSKKDKFTKFLNVDKEYIIEYFKLGI